MKTPPILSAPALLCLATLAASSLAAQTTAPTRATGNTTATPSVATPITTTTTVAPVPATPFTGSPAEVTRRVLTTTKPATPPKHPVNAVKPPPGPGPDDVLTLGSSEIVPEDPPKRPVNAVKPPPTPIPDAVIVLGTSDIVPDEAPKKPRPDHPLAPSVVKLDHTAKLPPAALAAGRALHLARKPAPVPLGLPRLKPATRTGDPAPIGASKFDVDPLAVAANAPGLVQQEQGANAYLAIDSGGAWTRSLRGSPKAVVFVSFYANISYDTRIDLAGAILTLQPGKRAGHADLMIGAPDQTGSVAWKPLKYQVPLDTYGGRQLAALPVFTVRLDPAAGVWDIYAGVRQIADGLPLVATDGKKQPSRTMSIKAGSAGAWLGGVVVSDENPLFVDLNANGIEDAYEQAQNEGALLAAGTTAADRSKFAAAWRKNLVKVPPTVLTLSRLQPDRILAAVAAKAPAPALLPPAR